MKVQDRIKEEGLKRTQLEWDSEFKPSLEMCLQNIDRLEVGLSNQDKKLLRTQIREFIETIESDLYPERKSKRNWLIGGAIVLVVIAIGLGIWFWRRKKKSDF